MTASNSAESPRRKFPLVGRPEIIAIVATSEWPRLGIGFENDLPWPRNKEDMAFFKEQTINHIVVMGRKTADSLPKALPSRENFVLSRNRDYQRKGFTTVVHIEDVINAANCLHPEKKIFVIGGAEIYALLRDYVDYMYQTRIKGTYTCDTFFPDNFVPGQFVSDSIIQLSDQATVLKWKRPD